MAEAVRRKVNETKGGANEAGLFQLVICVAGIYGSL